MSKVRLIHGDCLEVMKRMPDASVDAIVTDPPYGLGKEPDALAMLRDWLEKGHHEHKGKAGFMGREWDAFVPQPEVWAECFRVLKPGGYLLAFAGTRTHDLMTLGIRIAGFEIRDMLGWLYGQGFPKSMDVSKAIDKAAGAEREVIGPSKRHSGKTSKDGAVGDLARYGSSGDVLTAPATEAAKQWQGWGTALKPCIEPLTMARKPLEGTVAQNVLKWGTGALNIDACRIETDDDLNGGAYAEEGGRSESQSLRQGSGMNQPGKTTGKEFVQPTGRWPGNICHDGSPEVVAQFPTDAGAKAPVTGDEPSASTSNTYGKFKKRATSDRTGEASANSDNNGSVGFKMKPGMRRLDEGTAARFFATFGANEWPFTESKKSLARTAESSSNQSERPDCFAVVHAVNSALPEGLHVTHVCPELSTSATRSELRLIAICVTQAIQFLDRRFWLEQQPERLSLLLSPVSIAIDRERTGITRITASHWKSDGSAADATFSITHKSLGHGARDYEKSPSSQFMYCGKTTAADRHEGLEHPGPQFTQGRMPHDAGEVSGSRKGNHHVSVKPTALMQWLVRLVTPPGGTVLDPYAGSGSTLKAAELEGFDAIGIEREADYVAIAEKRVAAGTPLLRDVTVETFHE